MSSTTRNLGFGCELIIDSMGVGKCMSDAGEGASGFLVAGKGHLQSGSGTVRVADPADVQSRVG